MKEIDRCFNSKQKTTARRTLGEGAKATSAKGKSSKENGK